MLETNEFEFRRRLILTIIENYKDLGFNEYITLSAKMGADELSAVTGLKVNSSEEENMEVSRFIEVGQTLQAKLITGLADKITKSI